LPMRAFHCNWVFSTGPGQLLKRFVKWRNGTDSANQKRISSQDLPTMQSAF